EPRPCDLGAGTRAHRARSRRAAGGRGARARVSCACGGIRAGAFRAKRPALARSAMSELAAVIARARQPGEMSNRRRFTVARNRAIQKLREFALADPHDYVLELIQAAVANGAAYVDLDIDERSCTLSYIGGGLHEHELSQLFDFLFASKDRRDTAHVRSLAL